MNETLKLSVPTKAAPLSADDVAHYARTGWVAARGFYSPEEARAISRWTDELVAAPEVPGRHMVYREDSLLRSGERVIQRIENFCPFHDGFDRLVRQDRLMETVSRLFGSPPGYVGYDEGGQLTEKVRRKPYSVLLLDEIEKAHPDVYNILLQVMDNGMLTDAVGKKVDFRNVILIMTTNAGAADNARASIGFGRGKVEGEDDKAIQRLFAPEFRNRLDAIVAFKPLGAETIRSVVTKFVLQLEAQLADRNITIELTDEATDWLAKNGFDELYGARPLARVIQEHIKKPLADDILFGRLTRGGHVKVELKDGKIAFDITPTKGAAVKEEEEETA